MSNRNQKDTKRNRNRPRKRTQNVPLPIGGYPSKTMVKFRYCDTFALDPAGGLVDTHVFRATSLYDPDYTETGHQPGNFDSWLSFYNHYTVVSAKITMTPAPVATAGLVPGIFGINLADNTTALSGVSLTGVLEQGGVTYSRVATGLANGAGIEQKVVVNFSASKFFGKSTSSMINSNLYRGTATANPVENAYFECFYASIEGNNPGAMTFLVTIDFIASLNEKVRDSTE